MEEITKKKIYREVIIYVRYSCLFYFRHNLLLLL